MSTTFDAGVVITLTDKVSGGLAQIAKSLTHTQTAADALQSRFDRIQKTFASGAIMVGGGLALAAPLILATKSAMHLESALARVQIQTGANAAQMRMLNDTFTRTSQATGIFSKPTIAGFASEMYSSGIRDIGQLNALLPGFAKAADVVQLMSHGKQGAHDTLHSLVALAHQFGAYTPASMKPVSEAAVALGLGLPGGVKSLASTGSSVNIIGRKLGVDPVELMAFQAAVAQTSGSKGAGGRGALSAANQANFLKRAMPGTLGAGLITGSSGFAAAALGLSDKYGASTVMKNGKLDFDLYQKKIAAVQELSTKEIGARMMAHIDMLSKKKAIDIYPIIKRSQMDGGKHVDRNQLLMKLFQFQFGSAANVALLAGDATFRSQQVAMTLQARDAVKNGGINRMQDQVMKTLPAQMDRMKNSFSTLSSTIGMQLIPVLTPLVTRFNDLVDAANTWAQNNPRFIQAGAALLAGASALLILGGSIRILHAGFMGLQLLFGPVTMLVRMLGSNLAFAGKLLMPVVQVLGAGGLGGALRFALKFLGPIGMALSVFGLLLANSGRIMKFFNENQRFFIHIAAQAVRAVDLLSGALNRLLGTVGAVVKGISVFASSMGQSLAKVPVVGAIGTGIGNVGNALGNLGATVLRNIFAVDDLTAKRDQKTLAEKGIVFNGAPKGKGGQVVHQTNHVTIAPVAGHDHDKCYNYATKRLARDQAHAMSASSGNSVGRSNRQGGATRS